MFKLNISFESTGYVVHLGPLAHGIKRVGFSDVDITEFWISIESNFKKSEALGPCHMNYVLTVISEFLVSSG